MGWTPAGCCPAGEGTGAQSTDAFAALASLVRGRRRVVALTGAGVSTPSGIPDYRDATGAWKRPPPVHYAEFVRHEVVRRRYWSRSLIGWPRMAQARPNQAHAALARLEAAGIVHALITQNVDGLHQQAGSRRVIDLHGRLDGVVCLGCGRLSSRATLQARLRLANPRVSEEDGATAPDGDADLTGVDLTTFEVPACEECGGTLKPDVVFFGENVPRTRVEEAYARLDEADLLLVAGTSLMVFSGFRFVRAAARRGTPVAIVNQGRTRGDDLATVKADGRVDDLLPRLAGVLGAP